MYGDLCSNKNSRTEASESSLKGDAPLRQEKGMPMQLRGGEGQKGRGREVTTAASPCKYPGSTTAGREVGNFISAFDTNALQSISSHTVAFQATVLQ